MADLTVIGKVKCEECGKEMRIFKCFPDWGRDYEMGDPCPACKGRLNVTFFDKV